MGRLKHPLTRQQECDWCHATITSYRFSFPDGSYGYSVVEHLESCSAHKCQKCGSRKMNFGSHIGTLKIGQGGVLLERGKRQTYVRCEGCGFRDSKHPALGTRESK